MGDGPGVRTSDELLDIGSVGLRFFEVYLPLYAQIWDPGAMSVSRARQRYDEQRDLSFGQLRDDADIVAAAAQRLESEQVALRAAARTLQEAWRGAAGRSVGAHVVDVLGSTTQVAEHLVYAADVMRRGADELEQHVRAKADETATLAELQVDGRTAAEFAEIVSAATSGHPTGGDLYRRYLEVTLRPVVDSTWAWFDAICTRTDTAVRLTYQVVTDLLTADEPGPVRPSTATPGQEPAAQMRAASAGAGWFEPEGPQLASATPPRDGASATAADWLAGQDRSDSGAALASASENVPSAPRSPSVASDQMLGWAGATGWLGGAVPVGDASDQRAPQPTADTNDHDNDNDNDNDAGPPHQGLWTAPTTSTRAATDTRGTR